MKKHGTKVINLASKIGQFMEYWGFKQVHGKVWTLIFLSSEPVDANFLQSNLKISKALTSMTIKDLLGYKVILEVEKDKPGTQKYRINPEITEVIIDVIEKRELKMLHEILTSYEDLKKESHKKDDKLLNTKRLTELGTMVTAANSLLKGMTSGDTVDFKTFEETTTLS